MRKFLIALTALLTALGTGFGGVALADGPSGSTECHLQDDDCDGSIDEDPTADGVDQDGDGSDGEDPAGDATDGDGENEVDCNEGTSQDVGGLFFLYAADNGVETCADDGSALPVDGRVIVTSDQGGYVAADGDNSNEAPLNGYVRVDGDGLHCGDESNQDSTSADQSGNTSEDCG